MKARTKADAFRTTTVFIDKYENGIPVGCFYNQYLPDGKPFQSMTQFLLGMEQVLDDMDFPQAFTGMRQFAPPVESEPFPPEAPPRQGVAATFAIRILFRQNASWQGSVIWLEGRQEQSFRSVLELISLIDNALRYAKAS